MKETDQEKKERLEREEVQNAKVQQALPRVSHSFARRKYIEGQEEKSVRDQRATAEFMNSGVINIRMHRGSREDSMATLETIPHTFEAVQDYLKRHYDKSFTAEELTTELYARGAPKVDWDYIHILKCKDGVLAYTDRKVELKT